MLTLSGSVGGLTMNDMPIALQAEGFSVLHLSYFRGTRQNQNAELIPLEYFATALTWLQRQREVDPAKVGIVGPLPHLPHVSDDASNGGTMADNYAASLQALALHPESVIPVERIAAPILLVCGEADQIWPSCPMARQIQNRLRARGRPAATLLAYEDAGHLAFWFASAAGRSTCRGQWRNRTEGERAVTRSVNEVRATTHRSGRKHGRCIADVIYSA